MSQKALRRRPLPPISAQELDKNLEDVRDRLLSFIDRRLGSRYELERLTGLSHSVVVKWFRAKKPATPDTASLLRVSQATNLSMDWLLFDEGVELRGAVPEAGADALRKNVVAEVIASGEPRWLAEKVVSDHRRLKERLVRDYRMLIRDVTQAVGGRLSRITLRRG